MIWKQLVAVAVLGALGSVARHLVYIGFWRFGEDRLPLATFTVNMIGCLLFGLLYSALDDRDVITEQIRPVVLAGFLGALTTYSAFAFDAYRFIEAQQWLLAISYSFGQLVVGVIAVAIGMAIGKWF